MSLRHKLPVEIIDLIFKYTDHTMVLWFCKYMSNSTMKHLLQNLMFKDQIKKNNIITLRYMFKFRNYKILQSQFKSSIIIANTFPSDIDWAYLNKQRLSEDFIVEFQLKLDWKKLSRYSRLSEAFVLAFKDKVDWINICKYQHSIDRIEYTIIIENITKHGHTAMVKNLSELNQLNYKSVRNAYESNVLAAYINDDYNGKFLTFSEHEIILIKRGLNQRPSPINILKIPDRLVAKLYLIILHRIFKFVY